MNNPPFLRYLLVLFFSLVFLGEGFGQVDIVNEPLTSGGLPSGWSATSITFTSYARFTNQSSSVLTSPVIDLSGYTGVTLEFEVAKYGSGSDGPLTVEFSDDGGSSWTAQTYDSPTPSSSTYLSSGPNSINASGTNVQFRFIRSGSPSEKRLRNVLLQGIVGPACSAEPTAQATDIAFTDNSSTSVDVSWTSGTGGDNYILVAREANSVSWIPTDNNDYSGSTGGGDFSTASDQGSGNKAVYFGSGASTTVTGLSAGATYYFQVFALCSNSSNDYLTSTGTNNDGTQDYTPPLLIADNACGVDDLESTFTFTGGSVIGDVNLFVAISHTYRADLQIELESPEGTIVQLLDGATGGGANNLEVIFDDEAASTVNSTEHTIDGTEDQTVTSTTDLLSLFDGEDPNGDWILRICDNAGGDVGSLIDWSLDIYIYVVQPEPTNHPTAFGCFAFGYNEIDLLWDDAIGAQLPDAYLVMWSEVSLASIIAPTDGTFISDGTNAANIPHGDEVYAAIGLTQNTDYYFKIFPYTNSATDVDYKTDGTIQTTDCTTDEGPCGFETFENPAPALPSSYNDGFFVGDNGVTWNYVESRNDAGYEINGEGIMLRRLSDNSKIYSTVVPNGIANFTCNLKKAYSGSGDRQVELYVNGSLIATSLAWDNTSIQTFSVPAINISGDVVVEIRNITSNQVIVDDIEWTCYAGCTATHTVSDFHPKSGPAGTFITVEGTGFTATTDVLIGGNSVSLFNVLNDNTIQVLTDNAGLSGSISVIVSGCEVKTLDSFDFLDNNGSCSSSGGGTGSFASDLFISEVYDSYTGSLSYIEVFNGTAGTVDLDADSYTIVLQTGSSFDFPMSGNLNSGETYILRLGAGASICPGFSPDDSHTGTHLGFNGNESILLEKNGTLLDYVPNPNHADAGGSGSNAPGFSQSRNGTVTSPTATYNSTEWTISNTESCSDLGVPPFIPAGKNITINSHPSDVNCSAVTFTVDATSTENNPDYVPTTYTWRYVAPGDTTWSLVSALNGSNGLVVIGANTTTITITGNTSILLDYQFYVDMGTGGTGECRKYSNAASYTFDTKAYYRTVSNGDWSDLSIWEMADAEAGPYTSPVCQYPIDRTSDKIIILDGDDISLDVEISADWIEIEPNATLTLTSNNKLTLYNGNTAGPDLIVNGTLIDGGNSANGVDFYNDESTWEIDQNATIIKTSSSFATRYRDAYHNGIINIPSDATWIYRFTDNGDLNFANSAVLNPMYYPNLILENMDSSPYVSGVNDITPNLSTFTITGGEPLVIKGYFDVGGTGVSGIEFSNINNGTSPVLIEGELLVRSESKLYNYGGAATQYGTGFEIEGDLSIEGDLDLSGGTGVNSGLLKLSGDQDVIGVGGTSLLVNHFEMNKGIGFNGLFDLSFDVKEMAEFINGIIEFDNPLNLFSFDINATTSGASNTSYVAGKVLKTANTSTNFTFPIGASNADGNFYQPARIFDLSAGTATFEAQYFAEANPYAGAYYDGDSNSPNDNQEIGNCDYWTVNKVSGAGNAKLALTFTNINPLYCNVVSDETFMRIASLNPSNEWDLTDTGDSPDEIIMNVTILSATGGTYGDFAFMSTGGALLNVLPIELLSFSAKAQDRSVLTKWSTSTETNNDYFTLERSADAQTFRSIGMVDGAGTSHSTRQYSFVDNGPLPGVSYYRLKQTDFDGGFSYSDVRAINFEGEDGFDLTMLYRNEGSLNLVYKSISPFITVEIYDVLGKRVYTDIAENFGGRSVLDVQLKRGAYVVRISSGDNSDSMKMVW